MIDPASIDQLAASTRNELLDLQATVVIWQAGERPPTAELAAVTRCLHTIKGGFGFLGIDGIKTVTHRIESLLHTWRDRVRQPTAMSLPACRDSLRHLLDMLKDPWQVEQEHVDRVLALLAPHCDPDPASLGDQDLSLPLKPSAAQRLRAHRNQEQIYRITIYTHKDLQDLGRSPLEINDMLVSLGDPLAVAVDLDSIDGLGDCLDNDLAYQVLLQTDIDGPDLALACELPEQQIIQLDLRVGSGTADLAGLLGELGQHARSIGQQLGKDIDVEVLAPPLQLLPTTSAVLQSVLTHLLRNAVDHGIEDAATREAVGKDATGRLQLLAEQSDDQLAVELRDDGRGLDRTAVLERAHEHGLLDADQQANDEQLLQVILQPGFSSRREANDISGRGAGLDAVLTSVQDCGGQLTLNLGEHHGLRCRIELPLVAELSS